MRSNFMKLRKLLAIPFVYSLFRGFVGRDTLRREYVDEFIRPQVGDKVIDIGCGTGDMLNFLPEVDYSGFDISEEYIEAARRRFGSKGKFYCEPVSDNLNAIDSSFDIALAHGVLHHLSDPEANSLFKAAYRALKPGGRLVTFDGCYTEDQSAIARFFVSKDRGQFVRTKSAYESLARNTFEEVKVTISHNRIRIPYTHIVMECVRT